MAYWEILKNGKIVMGLWATHAEIWAVLRWYFDKGLDRYAIKTDIETGDPLAYAAWNPVAA
jgi:hypothetical protein